MKVLNKEVTIFPSQKAGAPLVILNAVRDEGAVVYNEIRSLTDKDFSMAVIGNIDWNADMSPWPIPAVAKWDTPCTGGADTYLKKLTDIILPEIINQLTHKPAYVALAGYSLGGLFAVYSMYRTDAFSRIASASGSFWYPDFIRFVKDNEMIAQPEKIYFSLGDQEAKTRNKILCTVQKNTEELYHFYRDKGITDVFELNPGNHTKDGVLRMAKAICWIIED